MPPAPRAPQPLGNNLVRFLIVALLVTSGVQAWQILEPPAAVYASEGGGPPLILNVTMAQPQPEEPASDLAANATVDVPVEPKPETGPVRVQVVEAPKYELSKDFEWEVHVSETPLAYTPWSGNGPPTVLIYYTGIDDVLMLHNAFVALRGFAGFDACSNAVTRYWNWTAISTSLPNTRLTYQSNPLPENPYNLFGTGENCYARAGVESEWTAMACVEGDGAISKTREEVTADGTIVEYIDGMDYCESKAVSFSIEP